MAALHDGEAAIHSGLTFDLDLITALLRAGISVYTGIGGYYLPGTADFDVIDAAAREGNASFTAGGNIPGLSADGFMAIAQSGTIHSQFQPPGSTSLEGLVFPDTYFVEPGDNEAKILNKMVAAFDQMASSVGVQDAAAKAGVTPYDVITVASLVEEEAKVDDDRGMIARTIYNRLQKNMKLGIDATVEYAIGTHKPRLTASDLEVDSPYNTRKYAGLPPTPIAAAGQKSLEAALNPTPGPWLYYVLIDPSGKHAFATTDAEFEQLVRQARAKGLV